MVQVHWNILNRNRLERDIQDQIKCHLRWQYESEYIDAAVIQDIHVSIRSKISQSLYKTYIQKICLFEGCSTEFVDQFVSYFLGNIHEEFLLLEEVILERGNAVDQLYFVCHGVLEEVGIGRDGLEETISTFEPYSVSGIISILCSIPQPYTVRVYAVRFYTVSQESSKRCSR